MLAQPVAGPFNLNDHGVVQKSVEQGRRDDGIPKNVPPLAEAAIRGQDHRALLIAGVDQLEEQIAGASADGEIADLINDEQRGAAKEADAFAQTSFAVGLGERVDDIGERREVDAAAGADSLDAKSCRQVTLAGTGRSSAILPGVRDLRSGSAIPFTRAVAKPSQCSVRSATLALITSSSGNPIGH